MSANIILAGVNIDASDTGVIGKYSGTAAFCIPTDSLGNVTVTLKGGTENTLKSGVSRAGLEKSGTCNNIGTLTVKGSGTLNAYGGNNITISGSEITVTGGNNGAGIGGGTFGDGSDIKIENSTASIIANAKGTGIGGSNVDLNSPNNAPGEGKNIIIDGGSVKISFKNPNGIKGSAIGGGYNRINGSSVAVTPKNKNGEDVFLATVSNENGDTVYIDGAEYKPSNQSAVDSGDTNLYAYITGAHHVIRVGDTETCYHYDGAFSLSVDK